eukprot:5391303-Lingulodinium_polyedra.AAC.1
MNTKRIMTDTIPNDGTHFINVPLSQQGVSSLTGVVQVLTITPLVDEVRKRRVQANDSTVYG